MNMRTLAWSIGAASLLSLVSCTKDNEIIDEDYEIITPGNSSDSKAVTVDFPTAFIGSFGDSGAGLKKNFTKVVGVEQARVIIIESDLIDDNETVLLNAYKANKLIVVVNPRNGEIEDWSDRNDIFYTGPEKNEDCGAYGFNNKGNSYTMPSIVVIDDDDVPMFHLCSWINEACGKSVQGVDLRSKDIRKRFQPQTVTRTFNIDIDEKKLVDNHWGAEGQLSHSTTANVTYTIYPFYVFDGPAQGEYYAVETEMVLHNAPLNNGIWSRRRGDEVTQMSGFYLNRCEVSASLLRKSNGVISESGAYRFADGAAPQPSSTADAASYNPGFTWSIEGLLSGGIPDSKDSNLMTQSNNWSWNNSASLSLPGIGIANNSTSSSVNYTLTVNGLPGTSDNIDVTVIPDPATGDVTFRYSWIWYVADVNASSTDRFYMNVGVDPVYQAYQWLTGRNASIFEFTNAVSEKDASIRIPLISPNRQATGSAIIRNSGEGNYYISDIKLWRDKSTDKGADRTLPFTIMTSDAEGGSGINATMLFLPAGEYRIEGLKYSFVDDKRVEQGIIYNTEPIKVPVAGNISIDFASPIFKVR
ncbi:MAG: hypothetical protein HDS79_06380 [Bacteroidales bacterium]|nr:hypothetical protein [Bacteroidales bacterium]